MINHGFTTSYQVDLMGRGTPERFYLKTEKEDRPSSAVTLLGKSYMYF